MSDQPPKKHRNRLRAWHKWLSLAFTPLLILFALSGIFLNHRELTGGLNISRNWLPANYSWNNWNLASIKGGLPIDSNRLALYGNAGVWVFDPQTAQLADMNLGFPAGMDYRKVSSLCKDSSGNWFAGSYFGLYKREAIAGSWAHIPLNEKNERVVKVLMKGDSLWVMTRDCIKWSTDGGKHFKTVILQAHAGEDGRRSLFDTIWTFHSGEIAGLPGKLFVDLIALSLIFLCLTGLWYWIAPPFIRKAKESWKARLKQWSRFSTREHNRIGIWALLFLSLSALTGIFLRPPLLILIASAKIAPIPVFQPRQADPWEDSLRDMVFDQDSRSWIIASSEGFFRVDEAFTDCPIAMEVQPPVSVMGITVFEQIGPGRFLVGSFSGIFDWWPEKQLVLDHFTGLEPQVTEGGPPVGSNPISGFLNSPDGKQVYFDYNLGALSPNAGTWPDMPAEIILHSPMSLWSASLEIHTGRIFEQILGPFYILVVPITGLVLLFILISGGILWFRKRKKKNI